MTIALPYLAVTVRRVRRSPLRRPSPPPLSLVESACLAPILVILLLTLALAWMAAPTAGDALSYHVARVAHWIQNGSVAFYPTNIDRQLWSNPWSEFVILQLQLISGGDRLSNLVQWCAFAGSIRLCYTIAGILGCNRELRYFAALIASTIPMAIAQASGSQTDLVAGFWLLVVIVLVLRVETPRDRRETVVGASLLGAALGIAILSKGTNYVYALPFLVWWAARQWDALSTSSLRLWAVVGIAAVAVNTTHYARNIGLYGWPLGPRGNEGIVNTAFGPRLITSNLVRNAALHVGTPDDTRLPLAVKTRELASAAVARIHGLLGVNQNDPRITWGDYRFKIPFESRTEILAGNPLHFILILVAFGVVLARPGLRTGVAGVYAACLVAAILIFCLLFRWQPFNSRLHLPIFLAASPLLASTLIGVGRAAVTRIAMLAVAALLVFRAMPTVLKNPSRALVGPGNITSRSREQRYFTEQPQIMGPYTGAADFVQRTGCRRLGLATGWAEWEYAFWAVAKTRISGVRIAHVGVTNASSSAAGHPSTTVERPCAIVWLHEDEVGPAEPAFPGYYVAWRVSKVAVLLPSTGPLSPLPR